MFDDEAVVVPISDTLDLHTFLPKEIRTLVPDYLEACREEGILHVRIIHGKGTGVLREKVHSILRRLESVETFQLADRERGDWGSTLVVLRPLSTPGTTNGP